MIVEETKVFYTCKIDKMFKTVFMNQKNPKLLEAVLSCVLGGNPKIIAWPTTFVANTHSKEKAKTRDLVVELDGSIVNLEVETGHGLETRSKLFTYHTSMWKQNILQGEKYDTKRLFLQIVLQFGKGPNKPVQREYKMHSIDQETGELDVWIENFKTIEINMERVKKLWYDKSEEDIEKYKYLMMLDMNEEELIKFLEKEGSDEIVKEYTEKVCNLNRNVKFINDIGREKMREYEMNTKFALACETVREEALEQGIEKGIEQGRIDTIKVFLNNGADKEFVIKTLNLTDEEINILGI